MAKRSIISVLLVTSGLFGQTIQNNAAPGPSTSMLAPLGLYDLVGRFDCKLASSEITDPSTLPTSLGGCTVTVDGVPVGLTLTSPSIVTFQAPLSGSVVQIGKTQIPVTFAASTVAAYTTSIINGVAVPVIYNGTGGLTQGTRQSPILIDQVAGAEISIELNGVGALTSYDSPSGPVPPGQLGSGFCNSPPMAMLDSTVLVMATETDGSGNPRPACKQLGATIQAIYFLPTAPIFNTQKAHTLTIATASYPVWVKYQKH